MRQYLSPLAESLEKINKRTLSGYDSLYLFSGAELSSSGISPVTTVTPFLIGAGLGYASPYLQNRHLGLYKLLVGSLVLLGFIAVADSIINPSSGLMAAAVSPQGVIAAISTAAGYAVGRTLHKHKSRNSP